MGEGDRDGRRNAGPIPAGARPWPEAPPPQRAGRISVLHVIPAVAERYGGPSQAVAGMCTALRRLGLDARLVTTDADGPLRLGVPLGTWHELRGVPSLFFPRQWSEAFKYSAPMARWLRAHVRDFDLVHAHAVFSHAPLAASAACRKSGVAHVVRPLGSLDPWSLSQKPWRKRLAWRLGVRRMLEGATAVHFTSEPERRRAQAALRLSRGVVVPLGVDQGDLERQADGVPPPRPMSDRPCLLFLGRLHPKKCLEELVVAFQEVSAEGGLADWCLVIAGEGDPRHVARLRAVITSRPAGGEVRLLGWLGGRERAAALASARICVLVSRQENFGLSAVEAMALGVPAFVSQAVDLAPDVESAGAGWVVGLDPASLRAGLRSALRSGQDELHRRGEAARSLVRRRFDWRSVAQDLAGLYQGLLGAGGPRPGR